MCCCCATQVGCTLQTQTCPASTHCCCCCYCHRAAAAAAPHLQIGCTLPEINCPDAAPYFRADVADVGSPAVWTGKLTGGQPTTNYCFRTAASQCPGSTVPVAANAIAGDSSAVILGCLNAPTAGTADLGDTKACPSVLPVAGDFSFYVVSCFF